MEYLNSVTKLGATRQDLEILVKLLAPLAPYFAEEAWQRLSGKWKVESGKLELSTFNSQLSIHNQPWPEFDPKLVKEESQTIVIQINGRVRDRLEVESNLTEEEILRLALDRDKIKKYIGGNKVKQKVFVKGKLLNLVI
jgi:leucyl-tRNA synthetase